MKETVKQSFNNIKLLIQNFQCRLSPIIYFSQIQFYNHSGKVDIIYWLYFQSIQITMVSIAEIPERAVLKRCIADLRNRWETHDLESYFTQLAGVLPASLLRRNSGTIIFLWNLEILFLRAVLQSIFKQLFPKSTRKQRYFILTLYFIMLKNGRTYFKNLAVWTPQDF